MLPFIVSAGILASDSANIRQCVPNSWYIERVMLETNHPRYSTDNDNLHITNITGSDEGFYQCSLQDSDVGTCLIVLGKKNLMSTHNIVHHTYDNMLG